MTLEPDSLRPTQSQPGFAEADKGHHVPHVTFKALKHSSRRWCSQCTATLKAVNDACCPWHLIVLVLLAHHVCCNLLQEMIEYYH